MEQYIAFKLGKETYCIDILKVQEIIKPVPLTSIPQAINYVQGIIKIREDIVTIIDIWGKMHVSEEERINNNIIIVKLNGKLYGFFVTQVVGVITVDNKKIEINPHLTGGQSEYVKGFYRDNDAIKMILDIDKLILR
jgi:chemotaxis signal transduction protein